MGIVEDDPVLLRNLVRGFTAEHFHVVWSASDGASAIRLAAQNVGMLDVLVVDLGLPDADGLDVVAALRSWGIEAPALALTARRSLDDRLQGFGSGMDDYLTKPFEFAELVARMDALVRRRAGRSSVVNGIVLDPLTLEVCHEGQRCALSPTAYRLLATLLVGRASVVRRQTLISAAWPPGAIVRDNTLDSYVTRLRRALRDVSTPLVLETVRGVGYRLR